MDKAWSSLDGVAVPTGSACPPRLCPRLPLLTRQGCPACAGTTDEAEMEPRLPSLSTDHDLKLQALNALPEALGARYVLEFRTVKLSFRKVTGCIYYLTLSARSEIKHINMSAAKHMLSWINEDYK